MIDNVFYDDLWIALSPLHKNGVLQSSGQEGYWGKY